MQRNASIHIGTSGWHYAHWKGPFYPQELSQKHFLSYYANHFHTVEINNSFYRLPQEKTLVQWRETVSKDFVFSVKASRYITHNKKLKDPQQALERLLKRIVILGEKLGPILFQLPPRWHVNLERLTSFLKALPQKYRYAWEFRDPSWFSPHVYEVLAKHKTAFCIYDLNSRLSPKQVTTDFIYVRLHGPTGTYGGQYTNAVLAEWAQTFSTWANQGRAVYCYFDNDEAGYAPQNALKLQAMIKKE